VLCFLSPAHIPNSNPFLIVICGGGGKNVALGTADCLKRCGILTNPDNQPTDQLQPDRIQGPGAGIVPPGGPYPIQNLGVGSQSSPPKPSAYHGDSAAVGSDLSATNSNANANNNQPNQPNQNNNDYTNWWGSNNNQNNNNNNNHNAPWPMPSPAAASPPSTSQKSDSDDALGAAANANTFADSANDGSGTGSSSNGNGVALPLVIVRQLLLHLRLVA
jgi:hypothetical protein